MHHMRHFFLLIIFFLGLIAKGQSPTFNFQKLGSEDGLNNANIFNIDQHPNGMMYFTTQNGIYYYDGYFFNKLEIDSLKSNALLGATIKNAEELYLSIGGEGIAKYHFGNKNYKPMNALRIQDNNADDFIIDNDYAYLLTWSIKLLMVDLKNNRLIQDEIKQKDNSNLAYCVYKCKDGKVLVGRRDGLYEVRAGRQVKLSVLNNTAVHAITQNQEGKLIIGSNNKLYVLNNFQIEKEIVPNYLGKGNAFQMGGEKSIDKVIADVYGRIWFTSFPNENLYLYENNQVYDVFEALDITPTLINCLFKDKSENLWIGTFNDGVYYLQNPFFSCMNFNFNNKNLNVNQVYMQQNLIVAATSNGLFGLNIKTNETKILSKPDEIFTEAINNILALNHNIYYTKRSEFDMKSVALRDSNRVYVFKPLIAKQVYAYNHEQNILADWNANILLCDAFSNKVLDTLITFNDYRISVNAFLKQGDQLYIGTNKGLFQYDFKLKSSRHIIRPELNYNINDIVDIGKNIYVAHEAGISEVNNAKLIQECGKFRLNSVKKIKVYNDLIWLATLDGILVCNAQFDVVKTFNKSTGLPSNSINDITFSGDMLCVSTARGIAYSSVKNVLKYSSKLDPVTIREISFKGESIKADKNVYHFSNEMESVNISFVSAFFNKPNKQFFKWRDNGEAWTYIGNPAFDLSLSGGTHQLEICASNDNINWSEATVINIVKEEKLSERQLWYWFLTLLSSFIIILISFILIRRVKLKAKRRLQDEQQVNLLKHQAMNALLSPHFIFNSLTSIQNYINTNNGLRASEYLAKFSRLIRMIIEKAALSEISLHDEITRLTYYLELEKERFKNKFDYSINLDENISTHQVMIPNMIIQPYVENSILHGILPKNEHGHLNINFKSIHAKKLQIVIEDNGIGLIKARELAKAGHKSIGTNTIQNILEVNSKLTGKKQYVTMVDKSTLDDTQNGTIITIEIEL